MALPWYIISKKQWYNNLEKEFRKKNLEKKSDKEIRRKKAVKRKQK